MLSAVSPTEMREAVVVHMLEGLHELIETVLRPHCAREREELVPTLRALGLERAAEELISEDEALAEESRRLRRALARIGSGGRQRAGEELIRVGEKVIAQLIRHIHREEEVLFPRLKG